MERVVFRPATASQSTGAISGRHHWSGRHCPACWWSARPTLTLELNAARLFASGSTEETLFRQLDTERQRFKQFLETRGSETGAWRGEIHAAHVCVPDRDAKSEKTTQNSTQETAPNPNTRPQPRPPSSSHAAGSEGWDGNEIDPSAPFASSPTSPSHMPSTWPDQHGGPSEKQTRR